MAVALEDDVILLVLEQAVSATANANTVIRNMMDSKNGYLDSMAYSNIALVSA